MPSHHAQLGFNEVATRYYVRYREADVGEARTDLSDSQQNLNPRESLTGLAAQQMIDQISAMRLLESYMESCNSVSSSESDTR